MSASSDSLTPPIPLATPIVGVPDNAAAPTSSPPIPTAAPAPTPTATTSTTLRSTTWLFATMPPPSTMPLVTTLPGVSGALRTEITAGNRFGKIVFPNSIEIVLDVTGGIFPTTTSDPIPTATGIAKTSGDSESQAVWAQGSAILLAILVAVGLVISVIRRRLRRLKEHPLARRERHLLKADRRMLQTTTSVVVDTLPRYDTTEQEHATGGAGLRARASALVIRPVSWTWARMSTLWSPQPPASPPPPLPPSPTGPGGTEGTAGASDGGGGSRHAWPWTSNSRAGQPPQRSPTGSSVGTNAGGGGAPHGTSEVGSAVSASVGAAAVTDPVPPVPPVTPTTAADTFLSSADALPAPTTATTRSASDPPATAAAAEVAAPPSNPIAPAPAISPPSASPRTVPTAAPPPAPGGASPPRAASPTLRPTAP